VKSATLEFAERSEMARFLSPYAKFILPTAAIQIRRYWAGASGRLR
jgi:hypothetical protein